MSAVVEEALGFEFVGEASVLRGGIHPCRGAAGPRLGADGCEPSGHRRVGGYEAPAEAPAPAGGVLALDLR
jgi:hypothetical protein